ncbi:MAG: transcription antitermination factor NusG [Mariniblastus sp.]|jgi:transcription antitermination factor NusG
MTQTTSIIPRGALVIAPRGDHLDILPSDHVRIMTGYFANYNAVVESVDLEPQTAIVIIDVLGRPQHIEFQMANLVKQPAK